MDQHSGRTSAAPDHSGERSIDEALGLGRTRAPSRRRWLIVLLIALAGIAAGYYFLQAPSEQTVAYRTQPAERGAITVEVSATGTLEPLTQVDISTELSGVVRSVAVDENQQVAQGDVLAELDTARIEAQIERAEANVAAAEARVLDAQITLTETEQALVRSEELASRGTLAEQALETARAAADRARSAVAIAQANVQIAEAERKLQQADLEKSTIYAPIDGIILTRSVNPGQTVSASTQAPVLFVIAEDLERMELKAAIDEADIGQVAGGQTSRFTVDAFPARSFDAEIRDVAYASVVTEGVVTYQARLAVANEELVLRPGMTATVTIVTREVEDALLVPAAAFRFSPAVERPSGSGFGLGALFSPPRMGGMGRRGPRGGQEDSQGANSSTRPLYVLENGQPRLVRVETGASDGENIEILSGLEPGAQVILGTRGG